MILVIVMVMVSCVWCKWYGQIVFIIISWYERKCSYEGCDTNDDYDKDDDHATDLGNNDYDESSYFSILIMTSSFLLSL